MSKLLTVQEVAEKWQLSPETIRELARRGRIPALRIGAAWRFDGDELAKWIDSQRTRRSHETEAAA